MGFIVTATYAVCDAVDAAVGEAAGRPSDGRSVTSTSGRKFQARAWVLKDFDEACRLRRRLAGVRGVTVTLREE